MALVPWLPHAFPASWFINCLCAHVVFKKIHRWGNDTIYSKLLLTAEVVCWNKLPRCWWLKDMKNYPLTINYYLLKHNGGILYIYIYIYIYILSLFVIFERQTNEVSGWWSSILLNISEGEAFVGEALVLGNISSCLWYRHRISSLLKTFFLLKIPPGISIPDWLSNHRSFRILLLLVN